mgnify:CR=1 FL=1
MLKALKSKLAFEWEYRSLPVSWFWLAWFSLLLLLVELALLIFKLACMVWYWLCDRYGDQVKQRWLRLLIFLTVKRTRMRMVWRAARW